jgi:hypothetical protein
MRLGNLSRIETYFLLLWGWEVEELVCSKSVLAMSPLLQKAKGQKSPFEGKRSFSLNSFHNWHWVNEGEALMSQTPPIRPHLPTLMPWG